MDNSLLFRDLKMEPVLDVMCEKSRELREICQQRLSSGLNTIDEIYEYQNELKHMIRNQELTEKIYEICCRTNEAAHPFRNFLHPRNASTLTPQKKLNAYLKLVFIIADGLCEIYGLQNDLVLKGKLIKQVEELKKIDPDNDKMQFSLSGKYGEGLYAADIHLLKIDYSKDDLVRPFFHIHRRDKKEYLCEGEKFVSMTDDVQRARNSIAYSLISITANFEMQLTHRLIKIQNEYGFGVGAARLWNMLLEKGVKLCYPKLITDIHRRTFCAKDLSELSIVIKGESAVPNTVNLEEKQIVLITGANQGGKTTFLRSAGQAQMMAQCGMFVAAQYFETEKHNGIFTHFPDEEDKQQKSGLLDQELTKLERIVKELGKDSMLLMNESFLTTTEYNACLISEEVINGFLMTGVKTFFVTHNYLFSKKMYEQGHSQTAFLKARIESEQKRTYQISEGPPERSVYAEKLYDSIVK